MQVRLTKTQKIKIANSKDIYSIMKQILLRENRLSRAQERFWVIGLNEANQILYIELVALGTANIVAVKTKDILRMAIYKLAAKIVVVHNHPSGILIPSESDEALTEKIKHGGHFTDIVLLDHLIISEKSYFSFKDKKLLK